jgi:hypothetical protein
MPSKVNHPLLPEPHDITLNEAGIEDQFIQKLRDLKYTHRPDIHDRATLEKNFREKFEAFNRASLTDAEFTRLLEEIVTPDVFAAAKTLRQINAFTRYDDTPLNYTFVNLKDWCQNTFEVVHPLRINTEYSHRRRVEVRIEKEERDQNHEGRKRPQGPHQTVYAANHPPARKPAQINGGPSAGQTTAPLGNILQRELTGGPSRTEQSRVHRQMRGLASGTGRIRVSAGTACRWRNRSGSEATTAPCRVRRTDHHLRHDHQESPGSRMKVEGGMMKGRPLLNSSFLLRPFLAIRRALIKTDRQILNGELRVPNRAFPNLKFELHPSNFATALPGQLFYSTQIPVCLWSLAKNKNAAAKRAFRGRRKQTLFIDARKLGTLIDRVHRELTDSDLDKITSTYHAWRGDDIAQRRGDAEKKKDPETLRASAPLREYSDVPSFCKSATTAEIAAHGYVLTPGRYVGAEEVADDGDPFEEKMPRLVAELESQFVESAKLEAAIRANLKGLGYAR